jgi:hypothetical protein
MTSNQSTQSLIINALSKVRFMKRKHPNVREIDSKFSYNHSRNLPKRLAMVCKSPRRESDV